MGAANPYAKPATGGPTRINSVLPCPTPQQRRCITCPPLRPGNAYPTAYDRRPSEGDEREELTDPPRRMVPRPAAGVVSARGGVDLKAHGVATPYDARQLNAKPGVLSGDRAGIPSKRRMRARSEHSGASRMGRAGRVMAPPLGR